MPSQYTVYYPQPVYAYPQYPTHRLSLISKFQNLKSQNLILEYFMTSLSENCFFLVCLNTVCLHSMPQSMPHPHSTQCMHAVYASAYTVCLNSSTHSMGRLVIICRSYPHISVTQVESSFISLWSNQSYQPTCLMLTYQ